MKHSQGTLVIIDGKNPLSDPGGFQTYAYNLGEIVTELGYDVHIFCFGDKSEVFKTRIGTVHVVQSFLYRLHALRTVELAGLVFLAPILARSMIKALNFQRPTILVGIGPWSLAGAFVRLLQRKDKVKLLSYYPTTFRHEFTGTLSAMSVSDHGLWQVGQAYIVGTLVIPFYTLLERIIMAVSDNIVNHYQSAEKILSDQFSVDRKKYIRIPYYVKVVRRIGRQGTTGTPKFSRPLVTLICRHDGRKGINYLLHAFVLLNARQVRYNAVIVGGGKLFKVHKKLADRLGLTNVTLPGFLPDTEKILQQTDVYVFPSVEEGSSAISILEAMSHQLPIVATAIDGIVEDIENEISGLLVPAGSPQALADAIERLLKDPPLARRLAKNAKERFMEDHGRDCVKIALGRLLNRQFASLI